MIQVDKLSCRVGSQCLLQDMAFALPAGQVVAIVGPNGAGKSTLLRVLSGEYQEHRGVHISGELVLQGRPLLQWPAQELAQRRSLLMQAHANELALSVMELVALGAYPHGGLRRDQQTVLEKMIDAWELRSLAQRAYDTLSGGERQRAQLARTCLQIALHEPASERLWLLDEPLTGLDLPHQRLFSLRAREQASAGALVLLSVHDINFALRTADTVLAMSQGRLCYAGPVAGLAEPALLRDIFGTGFLCLTHPQDGRPLVVPE